LLAFAIALSFHQVQSWLQQPQAVLVLGGSPSREVFAAEFAREHPDLPIWVSSGSNRAYTEGVFSDAGIDPNRLHLDYRAEDTVTNFTTLVDQFKARNIRSLYVITSDYHMRRAEVIGEIVLGSRGIHFKPIAVPSNRAPETLDKTVRDGARAVLWVVTGKTGATIAQFLSRF
jgi:uncharacterized SAM-binding protein YcdF (DUF218 family)